MKKISLFNIFNVLFFAFAAILFVYPFYQLLIISFNDATDAMRGSLYFYPRVFTLQNYKAVFKDSMIYNAYMITILRTFIGTVTSVLATGMFAYGLSKKKLMFRNFYLTLATITMFFSGGMITTFFLIRSLKLVNSFLVYIIPSLISVWNMIIMKSFFVSIPTSLEEAAQIDGYNDFQIFFKIIIPISTPIFAAIALFNGVGQWNAWYDAYVYISDEKLLPLQTVIMKIIAQNGASQQLQDLSVQNSEEVSMMTSEAVRITTMMISIGPIILIYPFLQKYFMKGIMIGAIKE